MCSYNSTIDVYIVTGWSRKNVLNSPLHCKEVHTIMGVYSPYGGSFSERKCSYAGDRDVQNIENCWEKKNIEYCICMQPYPYIHIYI